MERARALLVTAATVGAMLWPLLSGADGYPLSTYPMFSRPRPAVVEIHRAVGSAPGREPVQLPAAVVAGDEPMQVVATLRRAVSSGRADDLCRDVAGRVALDPSLASVAEVAIVSERHDTLAYFQEEDPQPLAITRRARCRVRR